MSVPNQMYTHELNPHRGYSFYSALVKSAPLASAAVNTSTPLPGMVSRLYEATGSDQGKLAIGLANPASGVCGMPIFLFKGQSDYDVTGDDGNLVGAPNGGASATWAGNVVGLVASGAFELETTEYTTNASLHTGSLLIADPSKLGSLRALGTFSGNWNICGVVSTGVIASDQPNGPNRLRFWPIFFPAFGVPNSEPGSSSSST